MKEIQFMDKVFNIGMTIKILSDTIGLSAFTSANGRKFYESNKKKIQRMRDFDILEMNEKDFSNLFDYNKKC